MRLARPRTAARFAALALAAAAASAGAQERPSEEDLFGKPEETHAPSTPGAPPAAAAAPSPPPAPSAPAAPDPLQIGGLVYLRADFVGREETPPSDWTFASPNLLDVYLDVRPNDRVRGYTLARMLYDPTGTSTTLLAADQLGLPAAAAGQQASDQPQWFLDQLWINFDVARTVFVTAGKQHAKWGVGKFWNPTDYLHRAPRNPLAVFDARTGVNMVRAHLPWEARNWNLYAVALLENTSAVELPVNTLGSIGGAARAEVVVGSAEIGLDAVFQGGIVPRYGIDVSAGVWDLDLYAEAALRPGSDLPRWRPNGLGASNPEPLRWEPYRDGSGVAQITAGGSWTWKYSDEDTLTVGAEYFFNGAGYDDAHVYTSLLAAQVSPEYRSYQASLAGVAVPQGAYFTPYYLGRQYASVYLALPAPGSWNDTTFTLSVVGNLSDGTAIARLDHSVLVNTYLRIETFVAGHLGTDGGEFRLSYPTTAVEIPTVPPSTFTVPALKAGTVDFGVALRVTL
jgi:hypothetical protein